MGRKRIWDTRWNIFNEMKSEFKGFLRQRPVSQEIQRKFSEKWEAEKWKLYLQVFPIIDEMVKFERDLLPGIEEFERQYHNNNIWFRTIYVFRNILDSFVEEKQEFDELLQDYYKRLLEIPSYYEYHGCEDRFW